MKILFKEYILEASGQVQMLDLQTLHVSELLQPRKKSFEFKHLNVIDSGKGKRIVEMREQKGVGVRKQNGPKSISI